MPRPRLPTAVKVARGTAQPCRLNPDEPKLGAVAVPAAPEHLDADGRELWARLARQVDALGVFTVADLTAFEILVDAVSYALELKGDGDASPNQKVAARNGARSALADFGLTPQSRGKVSRVAKDGGEDDPVGEFVQ